MRGWWVAVLVVTVAVAVAVVVLVEVKLLIVRQLCNNLPEKILVDYCINI
jgi:hypothetical protein